MFSSKSLLVILLLWTGVIFLNAQSNININHYTTGYGRSFRWVYDITQDEMGFIWMANHTGLRRYDGSEYITYDHIEGDSNSISTNTLIKVSSHNHSIWALGTDSVINKVDIISGKVTRIKPPANVFRQVQDQSIKFIHFGGLENGDFVILFQITDNQTKRAEASLWSYQLDKNRFEHQFNIPIGEEEIHHFSEREDGKLWLWGRKGNYYLVNLQDRSFELVASGDQDIEYNSGHELPIDENKNLWYPKVKSSHSQKGELSSFRLPLHLDVASIDRVSIDNKNDIWFYNEDDEVFHFDTRQEKLEKFVDPVFERSRRTQLMFHFFVDKEGGYWNGHFVGAVRFKPQEKLFDQYRYQTSDRDIPAGNSVDCRDILVLRNNQLLVKDNDHNLYLLDRALGKMMDVPFTISSDLFNGQSPLIYSLALGHEDIIWANGPGLLMKINLKSGVDRVFEFDFETPSQSNLNFNEVRFPRIFVDAQGQLWFCDNSGLYLFNEKTNKLQPVPVEHSPNEAGVKFEYARYDKSENKIYASCREGIYALNCESKSSAIIKVFQENESFDLLTFAVIKWKKVFWMATNKGLIEFNPSTKLKRSYTRKNGISSNLVFSLLPSDNELWLATLNGLCQFNPKTFQNKTYYRQHGLITNEFNQWSYQKTSDGQLFFGGPDGIIGFDPDKFEFSSERTGQLHLTNISTFNKQNEQLRSLINSSDLRQKIRIYPKEKNVSFRFRITLFDALDQNQYAYYLDGLESDWINIGNQNEVRYSHPPPGNYTFRVRAKGPDNLDAMNELAIPIQIMQHWYQRWWAKTSYFLLIMYVLWVVYRYQLKQRLEKQEMLRIKEIDQLKTKMYTNITHEFRTPLTVMLGMNDIVNQYSEKIKNKRISQASEMIKRNGTKLLDLINQLLDLSKLQSGKLQINYQQGNVIRYIKYLMESFQSYAEEKDIDLKFSSDQKLLMMDFDREKLHHIMGNLISNAIKYTPTDGNVRVHVSKVNGRNGQLQLKVTDNGQGIAPDHIEKIFDRFYQADGTSTRKVDGTGIGLYLVREMVHLLQGSIQVQSDLGIGTVFTVLLPITNNSKVTENVLLQDLNKQKVRKIDKPALEDLDKNKEFPLLLIVEDNADVAHYIGVAIQSQFRAVYAKNGQEGIEKAIKLIPDLIISDVMMPEKNGYELCEKLKRDERTSHIPIILLTAKADAESKIEGLELGADAYLAKPFDRKELLIRVKNLLNVRAVMQKRFSNNDFSKVIKKETAHLDPFLIKAKDVILENLDNEDFGIPALCKALNISRAQLHRKLVALTGHSASHLIRSIRLERAQELLLNHSFNISEVAYRVGFKTQAHFSRTFSEALGLTPTEFQNK